MNPWHLCYNYNLPQYYHLWEAALTGGEYPQVIGYVDAQQRPRTRKHVARTAYHDTH